jgi:hypothetical protein
MGFTVPKTWSSGETLTAANFNTYIRDNQLSFGPHLIALKASDQNVTASTTLVSDDTLFTPSIGANEVWRLTLLQGIITGAGGMKSSWQIPTSSTIQLVVSGNAPGPSFGIHSGQTASDTPTYAYEANVSSTRLYVTELLFTNAGTAGAVTLRWAQTSASGTSTVKANSTLWGVRVA